ncbi:MAG: MBL fold metallo-hydrolase RNA specificity domain-containing protein, partial [Xanthomonadales bacterium]|nr:MBL fold metallo-hydrolase RNA specificity domain-containing protein [Xanthomonadales bacterium]
AHLTGAAPRFERQRRPHQQAVAELQVAPRLGDDYRVRAQIHTVGGLSAHGDQHDLARWYACFEGRPPVYLVHGEDDARAGFARHLESQAGAAVHRPQPGEVLELGSLT